MVEKLMRDRVIKPAGRSMDYYTIRSLVEFGKGEAGSDAQKLLVQIVDLISTRAQPVVLGEVQESTETAPADLGVTEGDVQVFTLKFAIEHEGAWENVDQSLVDLLIAEIPALDGKVVVTFHDTL